MLTSIQKKLFSYQDNEYKAFSQKLIKTKYPIIGVRTPIIKNISKELINKNTPLEKYKDKYHEEILLHGYAIGNINVDYKQRLILIKKYLNVIDNWASCDQFTMSLKFIKKNKKEYYKEIQKHLKSNKEFIQRYALVCLLDYYVQDHDYLDNILKIITREKYNGYYSKMAGAWLLSYCFIFFFNETFEYVSSHKIDEFVIKKAAQKAVESYRVSKVRKIKLHTLY